MFNQLLAGRSFDNMQLRTLLTAYEDAKARLDLKTLSDRERLARFVFSLAESGMDSRELVDKAVTAYQQSAAA